MNCDLQLLIVKSNSMKPDFRLKLLSVSSLCVLLISCSNSYVMKNPYRETEIDSIRASIHGAIGWAKTKDFSLLYRIIANDSNYLEVDPGPGIIRGFAEFKKNENFWGNPGFKAISYDIRDLKINLSEKGDVAWYYCILDDVNEWKGQPACWMNARWTGVLEKRKGKWVIVQMHFSFAKE
jgi:ketosteroid isomerase-like protein